MRRDFCVYTLDLVVYLLSSFCSCTGLISHQSVRWKVWQDARIYIASWVDVSGLKQQFCWIVQYCDINRQLFEYGHYALCMLTECLSIFLVDVFGSELLFSVCNYGDKLYKQGGTPEWRIMQGFMWGEGCKCTRSSLLSLRPFQFH